MEDNNVNNAVNDKVNELKKSRKEELSIQIKELDIKRVEKELSDK